MLDHVVFYINDYAKSKAFYERALKPLGISALVEFTAEQTGGHPYAGFGSDRPFFWVGTGKTALSGAFHIAFTAKDHASVDAFYKAALAAGGKDNGPPGPRLQYHPDYYGAFIIDPNGHNIEAVCHKKA
jgi:catechol 2,3-dioxygenase-like lactoylglutathione lyase family enzyme